MLHIYRLDSSNLREELGFSAGPFRQVGVMEPRIHPRYESNLVVLTCR